MKAYSIFDDFPLEDVEHLKNAGIDVTVHPKGKARPDRDEMKKILEEFDISIIGTSQKIDEDMWERINSEKIIGTASVGIDHIRVPDEKKDLLTIVNAPNANTQSVAEYILGMILSCSKRILEANDLYAKGQNNKKLAQKPEEISEKTIGFVGAGNISQRAMKLLVPFGMKILCYTQHPEIHENLKELYGVEFVSLDQLARESDIISVNVPDNKGTKNLISREITEAMKQECIFISVSRIATIDVEALLQKAKDHRQFYVCLDLDVYPELIGKNGNANIMITPHIAGGTIQSRKRMFHNVTEAVISKSLMKRG